MPILGSGATSNRNVRSGRLPHPRHRPCGAHGSPWPSFRKRKSGQRRQVLHRIGAGIKPRMRRARPGSLSLSGFTERTKHFADGRCFSAVHGSLAGEGVCSDRVPFVASHTCEHDLHYKNTTSAACRATGPTRGASWPRSCNERHYRAGRRGFPSERPKAPTPVIVRE